MVDSPEATVGVNPPKNLGLYSSQTFGSGAQGSGTTGTVATPPCDPLNAGGNPPVATMDPRQILARHLYVLACLLVNGPAFDNVVAGGFEDQHSAQARILAQWAINVVDMRDRGSTMARFDYDQNFYKLVRGDTLTPPWAGWSPDGSHFVWGCERPDLLITETLALHDRRTQDTQKEASVIIGPNDNAGRTKPDTTSDTATLGSTYIDHDYDQYYRPQGSLFVKLFKSALADGHAPRGIGHPAKEHVR